MSAEFLPFEVGGQIPGGKGFLSMMCSRFKLSIPNNWNPRQVRIYLYDLIHSGEIYDNLIPWHNEYRKGSRSGTYVPIVERRPCIIYKLPKIIVEESVGMLFGENHFPTLRCESEETEQFLQKITQLSKLQAKMIAAAKAGAVGSVCVIVKVLNTQFYFDVMDTLYLFPVFDRLEPEKLSELTEKLCVKGFDLIYRGYEISDEDQNKDFWMVRKWTQTEEIYYKPQKDEKDWEKNLRVDKEKSSFHNFGFVPSVWIKNMPSVNASVDGPCTFEAAIDICIETDYLLSQNARLLRYSSDPTMVVKDASTLEGNELIKGGGILNVGENGDAFMVEMNGKSSAAVIEFCTHLRQLAMEAVRGNRSNPEKLSALNSGKALQMLNQPLISLASELRTSYGDSGLLEIYKIILMICETGTTQISDIYGGVGDIKKAVETMKLDWPEWYPETPEDTLANNRAVDVGMKGGFLSRETGVKSISERYNITDTKKELTDIEKTVKSQEDSNSDAGGVKEVRKSNKKEA